MSLYAKVDCDALTDARIAEAGLAAFGLWVRGLLYAKRHLTDGFVPKGILSILALGESAPKLVDRLVASGLWEVAEGGWRVPAEKWAKYQTTKDQVEKTRKNRSKGGKASGEARRAKAEANEQSVREVFEQDANTARTNGEQSVRGVFDRATNQSTKHRVQSSEHRAQSPILTPTESCSVLRSATPEPVPSVSVSVSEVVQPAKRSTKPEPPGEPVPDDWPWTGFVLKGRAAARWTLPPSRLAKLVAAYPKLDVPEQLRLAMEWTETTAPRRRKSAGGMPRFLTTWMNTALSDLKDREQRSLFNGRQQRIDPLGPGQHFDPAAEPAESVVGW